MENITHLGIDKFSSRVLPADGDDSDCSVSAGCCQESQLAFFRVVATRGTPFQLPDDAPLVSKSTKKFGHLWLVGGVEQLSGRPNLKGIFLGQYSLDAKFGIHALVARNSQQLFVNVLGSRGRAPGQCQNWSTSKQRWHLFVTSTWNNFSYFSVKHFNYERQASGLQKI